jgi:hypothetical protein
MGPAQFRPPLRLEAVRPAQGQQQASLGRRPQSLATPPQIYRSNKRTILCLSHRQAIEHIFGLGHEASEQTQRGLAQLSQSPHQRGPAGARVDLWKAVGPPGRNSRCRDGSTARLAKAGGVSRTRANAQAATGAKPNRRNSRTRGLAHHPSQQAVPCLLKTNADGADVRQRAAKEALDISQIGYLKRSYCRPRAYRCQSGAPRAAAGSPNPRSLYSFRGSRATPSCTFSRARGGSAQPGLPPSHECEGGHQCHGRLDLVSDDPPGTPGRGLALRISEGVRAYCGRAAIDPAACLPQSGAHGSLTGAARCARIPAAARGRLQR